MEGGGEGEGPETIYMTYRALWLESPGMFPQYGSICAQPVARPVGDLDSVGADRRDSHHSMVVTAAASPTFHRGFLSCAW